MHESTVTQRLAAILAADVAGYSRLMQDDERSTVSKLDECREHFRKHVSLNQGRIESMAGDAVLAVFETAIGAVKASVNIQEAINNSDTTSTNGPDMRFRIGVHLGDIIEKRDGTVYGDGVNIAARLEALADPGGVAVSSIVHDSVAHRLDLRFEHLGEHAAKNIAQPVVAYRILEPGHRVAPDKQHQLVDIDDPPRVIHASDLLKHTLHQAEAVAGTDAAVLIVGESGVGKELIARHIHQSSKRCNCPFIKIDCAAIPPDVFEVEFFGLSAGGLPGTVTDQPGRLEAADHGTVFLDHVGDLPAKVQARLLRPLHEKTFERVGDARPRQADVRFIAATTRDLGNEVASGNFRRDLYFRLSVFPVAVPPLRARPEDIPPLVEYFMARHATITGRPLGGLAQAQLERLMEYDWPGNVQELKNVIERAVIISGDGELRIGEALPAKALSYPARAPVPEERTPARGFFTAAEFEEFERNNLVAALEASGWQIAGPSGAAASMGVSPSKLRSRMTALKIRRPAPDSLYVRLGGSRGISTFARDLFGRAIAHPVLGRFWRERSTYGVLREEKLLVAYLSSVTGGPARYVGRDMVSAHAGLEIGEADWSIFRVLLQDSLDALSVPAIETREVVAFAEGLRDEVVQAQRAKNTTRSPT